MGTKTKPKETATKTRWDLIPLGVMRSLAEVLTAGAESHPEYGWMNISGDEHYAALMRHLDEYRMDGNKPDRETGLPVLSHALARLSFLMWKSSDCGEGGE